MLLVVQVDAAELRLDRGQADRGEGDAAAVLGHRVVLALAQATHQRGGGVHRVLLAGDRAGEHHRHPRLVDQDRVGLVHDRRLQRRLHPLGHVGDELVAQVVEAGLADRHVGDVAAVRGAALLRGGRLVDPPDGEPEQRVDRLHPLGVAAGQVVVDGEHVHRAVAEPDVPVRGDGRGERLALTGGHLGDLAGEQRHGAEQLHVVRALVEPAAGRLAADRADLLVLLGPAGGLGQLGVGELLQLGLAGLDRRQQLLQRGQVDRRPRALEEPAEPGLEPLRHTHEPQRYANRSRL